MPTIQLNNQKVVLHDDKVAADSQCCCNQCYPACPSFYIQCDYRDVTVDDLLADPPITDPPFSDPFPTGDNDPANPGCISERTSPQTWREVKFRWHLQFGTSDCDLIIDALVWEVDAVDDEEPRDTSIITLTIPAGETDSDFAIIRPPSDNGLKRIHTYTCKASPEEAPRHVAGTISLSCNNFIAEGCPGGVSIPFDVDLNPFYIVGTTFALDCETDALVTGEWDCGTCNSGFPCTYLFGIQALFNTTSCQWEANFNCSLSVISPDCGFVISFPFTKGVPLVEDVSADIFPQDPVPNAGGTAFINVTFT